MYLTKRCTFSHSFFVPKSGKKKLKTLIVKSRLLRLCVSTSISQLTKGKLPPPLFGSRERPGKYKTKFWILHFSKKKKKLWNLRFVMLWFSLNFAVRDCVLWAVYKTMYFTEEPSGAVFCYILLLHFVWFRWDLRAYDFQWNCFLLGRWVAVPAEPSMWVIFQLIFVKEKWRICFTR